MTVAIGKVRRGFINTLVRCGRIAAHRSAIPNDTDRQSEQLKVEADPYARVRYSAENGVIAQRGFELFRWEGRLASQLTPEPRAGDAPIALHGLGRYRQHARGLLDGEPAEIAQLDDLRLPGVERRQGFQRSIDRDPAFAIRRVDHSGRFLDRHAVLLLATALRALMPAGVVDEDLSHQTRRDADELI